MGRFKPPRRRRPPPSSARGGDASEVNTAPPLGVRSQPQCRSSVSWVCSLSHRTPREAAASPGLTAWPFDRFWFWSPPFQAKRSLGRLFAKRTEDGDHVVHLALHLFHPLLHVKDDFDAGQVDSEVAGQRQDDLEPLDGVRVVEAGVAFRPRRPQEALALVHAKRLRMDPESLRDHADAEESGALLAHFAAAFRLSTGIACLRSVLGATILSTPLRRVALMEPGSIDVGTANSREKFP